MHYDDYAEVGAATPYGQLLPRWAAPLVGVAQALVGTAEALCVLFGRGYKAIVINRRERKMVEELISLDDRVLKDIGVGRSELRYLARKVAENPGTDYRSLSRR